MTKFKYKVLVNWKDETGVVEAHSEFEAKEKVSRMYDNICSDDVKIIKIKEIIKDLAVSSLAPIGCLAAGVAGLISSAIPIVIAIFIVLGLLRACS